MKPEDRDTIERSAMKLQGISDLLIGVGDGMSANTAANLGLLLFDLSADIDKAVKGGQSA